MKPIGTHNYFVYILTNKVKTTLYVGVTNDLKTRIYQHRQDEFSKKTFAGKYKCFYIIYYERYNFIEHAIEREKEIKKWRREKKEKLINSTNPNWDFLNDEV